MVPVVVLCRMVPVVVLSRMVPVVVLCRMIPIVVLADHHWKVIDVYYVRIKLQIVVVRDLLSVFLYQRIV